MTRIATTHTRLTKIEAVLVEWFNKDGWSMHRRSDNGDMWAQIPRGDAVNLTELARHLLDEVCA